MKLVLGLVVGLVFGAACGNSAPKVESVQGPVAVEAKTNAAPTEAVVAAHEKGHEHGAKGHSCGDHVAAEGGKPNDCPFEHERKEAAAAATTQVAAAPAAGGCEHEPDPGPGGAQHLGTAFTITDSKPLGEVLKTATVEKDELVRVAGTVEKVCQKKGCWMVVRDGDLEARVIMKDHSFAIPFDSKGMKASIEGTLKVKVFTEAQAKHLAEDGKEDPSKVTGEKKEFLLTATGVQLGG